MKLNDGYIARNVAGESVIVAVGKAAKSFRGIAQANTTAGFIIELLKDDVTEDEIVEAVMSEYDVDKETCAKDVGEILAKLRSIGAIG